MSHAADQIDRLIAIMTRLRSQNGCPWDREQDIRSLRPFLLEETYEVLEQMDQVAQGGSFQPLRDELGDLLFQIVFHAQIASERGEFTLTDVIQAIGDKIEFRHPHVFGDATVKDAVEVAGRWARLKAEERRRKTGNAGSALEGVPREAPALMRAERLTEKASRVGFDWKRREDVRAKLDEELAELDQAMASGDRNQIENELGDVLFALVNLGRWLRCPPEDALRGTIARFIERFHFIEQRLREQGREPTDAALEEMDALWNEAKACFRRGRPHLPPATE
jgi:nucleoside triphosphate diphosphatase